MQLWFDGSGAHHEMVDVNSSLSWNASLPLVKHVTPPSSSRERLFKIDG
jgi:hypothetical protein